MLVGQLRFGQITPLTRRLNGIGFEGRQGGLTPNPHGDLELFVAGNVPDEAGAGQGGFLASRYFHSICAAWHELLLKNG